MNLLGHAYLSRHSEPLMIGNFIADFVKGNKYLEYDDGIAKGIILHRLIDDFTDTHPVFLRSKDRIRKRYRHYTGVIVDLFYDHYLARDWEEYAGGNLEEFSLWAYQVLQSREMEYPGNARKVLPYIINDNWLLGYASINGIDRSLKGLASRSAYDSGMEYATEDLKRYYREFESDFREFLPEIHSFVKSQEGILF